VSGGSQDGWCKLALAREGTMITNLVHEDIKEMVEGKVKTVGVRLFAHDEYGRYTDPVAEAHEGMGGGSTACYCIRLLSNIYSGKATFKGDGREAYICRTSGDVISTLDFLYREHYY